MLSIWRPSMDLQSFLREGCRYRAHHLSTSEGRKRSGGGSVQLTTTKRTQFQGMQVLRFQMLVLHATTHDNQTFKLLYLSSLLPRPPRTGWQGITMLVWQSAFTISVILNSSHSVERWILLDMSSPSLPAKVDLNHCVSSVIII